MLRALDDYQNLDLFAKTRARRSAQFLPKWSVSGKRFLSRCRLLQFSNFPADIVPLDKRQPVSKRNIYQASLALLLLLNCSVMTAAVHRHWCHINCHSHNYCFCYYSPGKEARRAVIRTRASAEEEHLSVFSLLPVQLLWGKLNCSNVHSSYLEAA